jgi:altronate dehydratase
MRLAPSTSSCAPSGVIRRVPTLEMADDDWQRIMYKNVTGVLRSCQVFGREMITGNARTARHMADNIDLDVSGIIDDTETLDQVADRLFAEVLEVASGRETKAEALGHREFAIHRRNPTI